MTKAARKSKTRAQWAAEIRAAHTKSVAAILKLGLTLTAAKKALPHGEWLAMVRTDLPFTATVAQRLMKIAADPKLANAARAQLLPPAWGTIYELSKLPEETFSKAASIGVIHPKMTRDDVRTINVARLPDRPLVAKLPTLREVHVAKPYYRVTEDEETATKPPQQIVAETKPDPQRQVELVNLSVYSDATATVLQLEQLVADLAMDVERGDVVMGATFDARIRMLADQLLSLVSRRRMATVN